MINLGRLEILLSGIKEKYSWHAKGRFKNSFEYILFFSKGSEQV